MGQYQNYSKELDQKLNHLRALKKGKEKSKKCFETFQGKNQEVINWQHQSHIPFATHFQIKTKKTQIASKSNPKKCS